ncbi:hypothetical protein Q5O14_05435 [Eubacteriaceae bacterium ES2]|nr:hypothetical protein Q5O14_05435 [Eubacteriaceae bacterium ES2]
MIIKIKNENFEVINDDIDIQELFLRINNILKKKNLQFLYLVIDGVSITENFDGYIRDNQNTITKIEVVCQNRKELVDDILLEAFNYQANGIPLIQQLGEGFYKDPTDKDWLTLADLFSGLQWLNEVKQKIDKFEDLAEILQNYEKWNEYISQMKKIDSLLPELQNALENRDAILIGDLLLYEIIPGFEAAVDYLRFLIPNAGVDYVS